MAPAQTQPRPDPHTRTTTVRTVLAQPHYADFPRTKGRRRAGTQVEDENRGGLLEGMG